MNQAEAMRPALDWSEAAMLPAQVRTLSNGAALRMLPRGAHMRTRELDEEKPAPAPDAAMERMRALRRAAYGEVRMGQRAKI